VRRPESRLNTLRKLIDSIAVSLRSARVTFRTWPLLQTPNVFVQLGDRFQLWFIRLRISSKALLGATCNLNAGTNAKAPVNPL
jgi:hypothetical protein